MDLSGTLGLDDHELVSFVGAGGKKTTMRRIARESDREGLTVVYTTTTHMPPPPDVPLFITNPSQLSGKISPADGTIAVASERVDSPERVDRKVRGFDPSTIDDVFESSRFDRLLVKADGARRREFKAPGPEEPAIPSRSSVVVVVASVRAIGSANESPTVHRPERVAAITGCEIGAEITPGLMGDVLGSDRGGCKDIPTGATAILQVNKVDTDVHRERANAVISETFARTNRFDGAFLTSFETNTLEVVEPLE